MRRNADPIIWRYLRHVHLAPSTGMLTVALALLLAVIVIVGFIVLESEAEVIALLDWLDRRSTSGPILFTALYAVFVVLVLPSVLLTLGAGFLFGVVQGTFLVMIGETIGATLAFLIGRHFLGDQFADFLTHHARLRATGGNIRRRGWRVVLLTRLTPFFPGKLANYVFGLWRYSLPGFIFGNVIGIVPITVFNVYIGSLAADFATLGTRGVATSPIEWGVLGGSLAVAVAFLIFAARAATRALNARRQDDPSP